MSLLAEEYTKKYTMNTYKIEIQEFLSRIIEVKSNDINDAISKINDMYKREEIVLNSDDFIQTEINEFKTTNYNEDVLSNGNNFYLISDKYLYFWGLDIDSKKINIDHKIQSFIQKNNFVINEVSEFNQVEDYELFKLFYR